MNSTETKRVVEWFLGGDTGTASATILSVMVGVPYYCANVPDDFASFGRCHRLLHRFPKWRARLHEVAERYPVWGPIVREWDALTACYERFPFAMHAQLRQLTDEGRLAAGWTQTAPGCWRGPGGKPTVVELRAKP